jgi:ribosomal protein L11 methyltransferase
VIDDACFELTFAVPRRVAKKVSAILFEAGAGAVEERAGPRLVVWALGRAAARRLATAVAREFPGVVTVAERELDPSWQTDWMQYLEPVLITDRIVFQPTTRTDSLPRGKRRIWFAPDQAFGEGNHPTTRLAARATERHCRQLEPSAVLDVGTGNGVLAMVAASCRAPRVLGIDLDQTALRAARKNARLNRLSRRCSFSARPLSSVRGRYDLVIANIEAWVLLELAGDLARVTAPAGRLLLSGLLRERGDEILARFADQGLREESREQEAGWLALVLGRF